ncbi:hypothetical protein HN014_08955 [Aquimarina sp. TRL1]|uniref:hypothetical protein n=1 Tax=Aquimarina sp. (strain TRL1) TaxID=2736252 RepID=UPI00158BBD96|nr:hypothetical protein [Aquimarina sp. TRL1]QKX05039.1 hypothetical protein HN014_08955 [Aquimarina sp. TRL1]
MKTSLANLGRILNKMEQQHINGGGTCQYYSANSGLRRVGLSMEEAKGLLHNAEDHWCCNSCSTASWANAPTEGDGKPRVIFD